MCKKEAILNEMMKIGDGGGRGEDPVDVAEGEVVNSEEEG